MTKDKFLKRFFALYIVLVLQNVISLAVNLADNIMLGAYSEQALAGAAAVNQVQFVYQQLLTAMGDGLVIFCSQYWGKRQTGPMKRIAVTAMHGALVLAVILTAVASLYPYRVVSILTQILLATLRSIEMVKVAFYLSISTFCINCGINYVLIYGRFGAPEMGTAGAAIGTLTARIMEVLILILYIAKKEKTIHLRPGDYLDQDVTLGKDYVRVCLPMLFVQGLWGVNTALQTVILGHMASNAIAANSVASTLFLLVKSMAVGASSSASVLIGQAIGRGDLARTKAYALRLQKIFVLIGIVSGSILFLIRIPVLGLYDLSNETRDMANAFLIILSVVCVGMSYQMPTNNGIIRGGGNAMFVVKMDLVSIWMIVLPLSFYMAFVVKASPVIVVCCLNADQIFKCIPAFLEVNYGNWIRKLTRD